MDESGFLGNVSKTTLEIIKAHAFKRRRVVSIIKGATERSATAQRRANIQPCGLALLFPALLKQWVVIYSGRSEPMGGRALFCMNLGSGIKGWLNADDCEDYGGCANRTPKTTN